MSVFGGDWLFRCWTRWVVDLKYSVLSVLMLILCTGLSWKLFIQHVRGSWMLADAMMLHFSYLACTECVIYSCLNGKTNSVIILIQSHLWQSFYTTRLFNDCNFWNVLISWFAVLITYNYMCACGWNYTNLKVILNLYPALKYFKLYIHSKSCFICFMHWCFPLTPSGPGLSIISQHNNANKQDVAMQ